VTIKDLARECGVNVSTISRALSGSYGVNEETRRRVLAAAARLKYRPNRVARAMATGQSHTLALIVSDVRNPYFADVARGAEDAANEAGRDLILCNTDLDARKQMRYVRTLVEKRVDGIVMNSTAPLSKEERAELENLGCPVVLLNRVAGSRGFSTVSANNEEGGRAAGRYLAGLGHKEIAHITGPDIQGNLNDRAHGFTRALNGIAPTVLRGEHSFRGGYALTRRLFDLNPATTAIFAANDAMAFGCLRALMELGRRVPDDVSVIGFDNVDLAEIVYPPLTTIHQPRYEIGRAAVEIVLSQAEEERPPEHRVLGVQLIERQSCRRRT
jgi:LacI family transcriptional regulator